MAVDCAHGSYSNKGVNVYNLNLAAFKSEMGDRLDFQPTFTPFNPIYKEKLGNPAQIWTNLENSRFLSIFIFFCGFMLFYVIFGCIGYVIIYFDMSKFIKLFARLNTLYASVTSHRCQASYRRPQIWQQNLLGAGTAPKPSRTARLHMVIYAFNMCIYIYIYIYIYRKNH